MELTDIASVEEWEKFEKDIHEKCGMNSCVYNNQGNRITKYTAFANEVCPTIKGYSEGLVGICATVNQYFGSELSKTKEPLIDECDAGFVKFAVPIVVNDEFLGTVGGCGHLLPGSEVETFLIEKVVGRDDLELEAKLLTVKEISKENVEKMVTWVNNYLESLMKSEVTH